VVRRARARPRRSGFNGPNRERIGPVPVGCDRRTNGPRRPCSSHENSGRGERTHRRPRSRNDPDRAVLYSAVVNGKGGRNSWTSTRSVRAARPGRSNRSETHRDQRNANTALFHLGDLCFRVWDVLRVAKRSFREQGDDPRTLRVARCPGDLSISGGQIVTALDLRRRPSACRIARPEQSPFQRRRPDRPTGRSVFSSTKIGDVDLGPRP